MTRPWRFCDKEVAPFIALVTVQFTEVGVNVLFKEATAKGLSYYAFIFYSFALSNLVLLIPLPFIIRRSIGLSSLNFSLVCKIFSLGLLAFSAQLCGYKGIEYSSPSLASAASNLLPAFIFIFAVLFKMEKIGLRSSSTQAKILGSVASIAGALIVVLYKGPIMFNYASPSLPPSLNTRLGSSQRNWILGGFLLTVAYLLMSILYIVLTHVIKLYPAELIVVFLFNLFATIVAAPVCFLAERNFSFWRLQADVTLVAVIYSVGNIRILYQPCQLNTSINMKTVIHFFQAFFSTFFSTVVHTWGVHVKGPVYVSIFKPLSIAIAAAMSVIFLGEALYLGSVVGAVILSVGFYCVIWGKAKDEELHENENHLNNSGSQSSSKVPLLQSFGKGEDI